MKSILIGALTAILAAGAQSSEAERQLKAAMNAEMMNGDLQAAIRQYGDIAAKYKTDRAVAAMALVRMAEAYQKVGDSEAIVIFQRVLRDYGEQKEAVAMARARLGSATASGSGGSTRQLWTKRGGAPYGPMSPDGRYLAFTSYEGGGTTNGVPNVAVHDFVTGADVVLTHSRNPKDHPTRTGRAFSPDSRQIAYPWVIIDGGEVHSEVRISDVSSNGSAKPRVVFRTEDRLEMEDWSPDGKWIALQITRKDGTSQLVLISTADGSLKTLKSVDWTGSTKVYFSPDSRFVAFDLQVGERSESRDIFVLAVDGSRQVPAVTHPSDDRVAGWTPDGKHLLFVSDRNGLPGLWWLRFEGGMPQGDPEILRSNFGANVSRSLGPGRSAGLYYLVQGGATKVSVGSLDLASGKLTPGSSQQFMGNIYPAWSPDGKHLAYSTYEHPRGDNIFLTVRSIESGQSRELRPQVKYPRWASWSPDGRSILVEAWDIKGRAGIFQIDAQNADAATVVSGADGERVSTPQWLPDGKKILYLYERRALSEGAILLRDLASGGESEIIRIKTLRNQTSYTRSFVLSPDGRSVAYLTSDGTSAHTAIMLKTLAGGEPRELLKLSDTAFLHGWTPDGQAVVYGRSGRATGGGAASTDVAAWLLPIRGGEPRRLDLGESFVSQVQLHPDGKQIAFWSNNQTGEQIWVLENHLPTLTAKK
ncbi:MAG: PD40 domain-containing protein [Bryobacterales bacterium]|nr:PD40 domain-containing protein [Bryobacterales bacterium]